MWNDTILMLLADHPTLAMGGPFFTTFSGQYEQNLPMAYILLPESFKRKFPQAAENLNFNAKHRLTSHLDLHKTGLAIVEKRFVPERNLKLDMNSPGMSLFEKIPESRSCNEAGIPDEWCACGKHVDVSPDDSRAVKAAQIFLNLVKNITASNSQFTLCAPLGTVTQMKILKVAVKTPYQDLTLHMQMLPYTVLFKVVFRIVQTDDKNKPDVRILLVERMDKYGPMTKCLSKVRTINEAVLDMANIFNIEFFCVCKDVAHEFLVKR